MSQKKKTSLGSVTLLVKMIFEGKCLTTVDEVPELMTHIAVDRYDAEFVQALIEKRIQVSRLPVAYTSKPMDELRWEFDWVSDLYDGRPWKCHGSCKDIDTKDGERQFALVKLPEEFIGNTISQSLDGLATDFDKKGFRFAIEVEAIAFAKAHPKEQRKYHILALGSSALGPIGHCVAMLDEWDLDRRLDDCSVEHELYRDDRLLLVRKDA